MSAKKLSCPQRNCGQHGHGIQFYKLTWTISGLLDKGLGELYSGCLGPGTNPTVYALPIAIM